MELISKVCVTADSKLLIILQSGGHASYQHIYREAAGVYWDADAKGFISTDMKDWSCVQWFSHICATVKSGLNIELRLSSDVEWVGLSTEDIGSIKQQA